MIGEYKLFQNFSLLIGQVPNGTLNLLQTKRWPIAFRANCGKAIIRRQRQGS